MQQNTPVLTSNLTEAINNRRLELAGTPCSCKLFYRDPFLGKDVCIIAQERSSVCIVEILEHKVISTLFVQIKLSIGCRSFFKISQFHNQKANSKLAPEYLFACCVCSFCGSESFNCDLVGYAIQSYMVLPTFERTCCLHHQGRTVCNANCVQTGLASMLQANIRVFFFTAWLGVMQETDNIHVLKLPVN